MIHPMQCINCGLSDPPLSNCEGCNAPLHRDCSRLRRWVDDNQEHRLSLVCSNCHASNPEHRRRLPNDQLGVCGRLQLALRAHEELFERLTEEKIVVEAQLAPDQLADPCSTMDHVRNLGRNYELLNAEINQLNRLHQWLQNRRNLSFEMEETRNLLRSSLGIHRLSLLERLPEAHQELERCRPLATLRSQTEGQLTRVMRRLRTVEDDLIELRQEYQQQCVDPIE